MAEERRRSTDTWGHKVRIAASLLAIVVSGGGLLGCLFNYAFRLEAGEKNHETTANRVAAVEGSTQTLKEGIIEMRSDMKYLRNNFEDVKRDIQEIKRKVQ